MSIDPTKVLEEAAAIIKERGVDYGGIEENFTAVGKIFHRSSSHAVEPYEAAIFLACVKLARMKTSPQKRDNYVDAVAYLAFACELAGAK